jgi:DNA-binding NtrC family response regulator
MGHCDESVLACLRQTGWTPEPADLLDGSNAPVGGPGTRVALLCLPTVDHGRLRQLEAAASRWRHLDLIAIVGPDVIDDEPTREFVAVHCADYQTQPVDCERLIFSIGHLEGMATLARHVRNLSQRARASTNIIGRSPVMQALRHDIERIARVDAPVIITGESGTGKELAALAVHRLSSRCQQPFVAVNCVSLSPSLIHAELFGYERGAFTGAVKRHVGHLEAANHGTILLDEIGDLAPELQILLLRFLEQGTIRRVGGREEITLDVRVIAATHVDLEAAVRAGRFRDDLYYRLNVLRLHMPALRERREDIPELADAFLERFRSEHQDHLRGFSSEALRAMQGYDWPGNVRELMNRVRRAIVMSEEHLITPEDLQFTAVPKWPSVVHLDVARLGAERDSLLAALRCSGWNVNRAADLLGVSRATLYRLVERHHVSLEAASPTGQPDTARPNQVSDVSHS